MPFSSVHGHAPRSPHAGHRPTTAAQGRARLRRRFWYATAGSAYGALLVPAFALYAASAGDGWYLAAGIAGVAAVLYGRSARRRWLRWQDAKREALR